MLKSLEQWICDRCGQVIEEPNQGSVEWIDDSKTHKASGFKIVHQSSYAPHDNGECYRSDSPHEPVSVFGYRENTPFSFSTTLRTRPSSTSHPTHRMTTVNVITTQIIPADWKIDWKNSLVKTGW